ncbi:TPA: hypothetical protein ACH3X2_005848 [Trebouxia sp. C0005]
MNWSVFSASSAAQSQHHKRALLLEQALIKGSGLLSTSPQNSAAQGHAPDKRSHTSPARLQGITHLDHDPQGPGKTGDLSKPPASPNFQHVVRGRSPSPSLRRLSDLGETDEAGPLNPAAAKSCMHEGLPNTQAESGKPAVQVSANTLGNATIPVHQEAEASHLMSNSWKALLELSDNYDRDQAKTAEGMYGDDGGAVNQLANDSRQNLPAQGQLTPHEFDVNDVTSKLTAQLLAGSLPLTWEDQKAHEGAHLLVMPSDQPSNRRDALAVQAFLSQLIHNPSQAFEMAAAWRGCLASPTSASAVSECVVPVLHAPGRSSSSNSRAASSLLRPNAALASPLQGIATGPLTGSLRSPSTLPWASSPSPSPVPSHHHPSDYTYMPLRNPDQQHEESLHADGDVGWKLYCTASFTTAMAVVMAELTRQVEVQCSERAHALALAWNLYSAAMDTCLGSLQAELHQLSANNIALAAENMQMKHEMEQTVSLQKELALSKQVESSKLALEREAIQLTAIQAQLQAAEQELHDTQHHMRRRLILARWHLAGTAVSLPNPADLVPAMPPNRTGNATSSLVKQAQALERITAARSAALQQVQAVKAKRALDKGVADLRKDGTAGDAFSAAVKGAQQRKMHDMLDLVSASQVLQPEAIMKMLSPEAQAGLMSGLNSQQRHEMYTKISDDSLAGMLVVMRFPERLKMLREVEQVDQALVDRVLRYIRLRPALAGKWLAAMPAQEALSETEQMTAASVSAALSAMKPEQAAQLLQDLPREDQRQLLLSVPFAHMSLILQALPGQACMEALLSIGAPLCKDLLLSMPSPASVKLLHAASTADLAKLIQGLESEDASLVTGMLAPKRLDQLNEFLGASVPVPEQVNEPSLTTSSLHGLSLGDKVATLSALQPSVAAAILGVLSRPEAAALLASIPSASRSDVLAQLDPLTINSTASELRSISTMSIGKQELMHVMRHATGLPSQASTADKAADASPDLDLTPLVDTAALSPSMPKQSLGFSEGPDGPEALKSSLRRTHLRSSKNTSPDKRRSLAADARKGMSRTKSLAPLAASKNLVTWSSPAEPQALTKKLPPIKRVSRESNISDSPRSSATGDSFDIESEISSVTSHGSFMSVVRAAKLAADQGIAAKLGSPIRNQRLADIVAHRPQATVRSLKWLIGILDNILKQVDASQKKASKLSIPELAFGGFQRKYGELMASEYMASMVNTVAKYRLEDERIELLAKFLTEEWSYEALTACGAVYRMCTAPCPFPCIEYPAQTDNTQIKSSRQIDLTKAVWISDSVLGIRSVETRAAFINQLQTECTEAAPEDMQWLVKPVKEESSVASGPQMFKSKPALSASAKDQERTASVRGTTDSTSSTSHGWKMKRIKLMSLVCAEMMRIEAVRMQQLPYIFQRLPLNVHGNLPFSKVHDFIEEALPANSGVDDRGLDDLVASFVSEAMAAQVASEGIASQSSISMDAFFAACHTSQVVKNHIKLTLTGPVTAHGEDTGPEEMRDSFVTVLVARHFEAMWVHMKQGLDTLPAPHHRLMDQAILVTGEQRGSLKLEAYSHLLQELLIMQLHQVSVASAQWTHNSDFMQGSSLEQVLSRVEDAVLMLQGTTYMLAEKGALLHARGRRLPPSARVEGIKALIHTYKQVQDSFAEQIVMYLQTAWRRHKARKLARIAIDQLATQQAPAGTSTLGSELDVTVAKPADPDAER